MSRVLLSVLILALLSAFLYAVLSFLEKRFLKWQ